VLPGKTVQPSTFTAEEEGSCRCRGCRWGSSCAPCRSRRPARRASPPGSPRRSRSPLRRSAGGSARSGRPPCAPIIKNREHVRVGPNAKNASPGLGPHSLQSNAHKATAGETSVRYCSYPDGGAVQRPVGVLVEAQRLGKADLRVLCAIVQDEDMSKTPTHGSRTASDSSQHNNTM
jgi:hypothetical protein